jgi:hypothetical protein
VLHQELERGRLHDVVLGAEHHHVERLRLKTRTA